jgi:hypothetical protein
VEGRYGVVPFKVLAEIWNLETAGTVIVSCHMTHVRKVCFALWMLLVPSGWGAAASLSKLVDPQRLETLSAEVFEKDVYQILWVLHAERRRTPPESALKSAYDELLEPPNVTEARVTSWMRMMRVLSDTGVLENAAELERLRQGAAPRAARGFSAGAELKLRPVVPARLEPQLTREITNMTLAASTAKVSRPTQAQLARMRTLFSQPESREGQTLPAAAAPMPPPPRARAMEVEVEIGRPYNMASWGGPEKDFVLISEEANSIRFAVLDYLMTRRIWRTDEFGYPYPVDVPVEYRRQAAKTNAISIPGTLSKLYPIYEASGFQILFNDTLATQQNHRKLHIQVWE